MTLVDEKCAQLASRPSDINEHFPTLRCYATGCQHVVEMGVRNCVSTWALLAGRPKQMTSIDLRMPTNIREVCAAAAEAGVAFSFVMGDSLAAEIREADLLFLDTWHAYAQLIRELRRHAPRVRRCILIHDTTLFSTKDQARSAAVAPNPPEDAKQGLWTAIEDFIAENPLWEVKERFANNNGLTVLCRKEREAAP